MILSAKSSKLKVHTFTIKRERKMATRKHKKHRRTISHKELYKKKRTIAWSLASGADKNQTD